MYWPSKAAKNRHYKAHKYDSTENTFEAIEVPDEFESDSESPKPEQNSTPMPVFDNIRVHIISPFVQITDCIKIQIPILSVKDCNSLD